MSISMVEAVETRFDLSQHRPSIKTWTSLLVLGCSKCTASDTHDLTVMSLLSE